MTLFTSRHEFAAAHAGTTKWDRMLAAIDNAERIPDGVAHSIGDSLTYRLARSTDLEAPAFVGHRRYQTAFVALDGVASIEVVPTSALDPVDAYCDLSDLQSFTAPPGSREHPITVAQGQILAVPITSAWRVAAEPDAQILVVRLTVEGATFHNK